MCVRACVRARGRARGEFDISVRKFCASLLLFVLRLLDFNAVTATIVYFYFMRNTFVSGERVTFYITLV
jgi:hypothetical protein